MKTKTKGPWFHRLSIHAFTVALAVIVFWLLGFLVNDIRSVRGPDYSVIESRHVDRILVERTAAQDRQIAELSVQIVNETEKQRVLGDSSQNLQQTIAQLIELQRLGMEKSIPFSETEQANFSSSLNLFLDNQRRYQTLSQTVTELVEMKQGLEQDRTQTAADIEEQRIPARAEFERLMDRHRLKLAFYQLGLLLPILGIAAVVLLKTRGSIYYPLYLAFGAATLLKVALVMNEYFPTRYFKYVLIVALLLVVARLLVYFIRVIAFPKTQWLVKQYREAYEMFLCPVCEFPIRTGPRRFLYWTRRSLKKLPVHSSREDMEEVYTCPSCGNTLFEECASCHKIRHSLLPHCAHCGAEKTINA